MTMVMQAFPIMSAFDMPVYQQTQVLLMPMPMPDYNGIQCETPTHCEETPDHCQSPVMCGNCSIEYSCTRFCNSCASLVCNRCMAEEETCCLECLATFPVYPSQTAKSIGWQATATYDAFEKQFSSMDAEDQLQKFLPQVSVGTPETQSPEDSPRSQRKPWASRQSSDEHQGMTPSTTRPGTPSQEEEDEEDLDPTLMLCNIPCRFNNDDIAEAIDAVGFAGLHDFVNVPGRAGRRCGNIGYAFVHFKTPEIAAEFAEVFQGYQFKGTSSKKRCEVKSAHMQGFNGRIERPHGKAYPHRRMLK